MIVQYEPTFDVAKTTHLGHLNHSLVIELIVETDFCRTSAAFFLNALLTMPSGDAYKKTISNSQFLNGPAEIAI